MHSIEQQSGELMSIALSLLVPSPANVRKVGGASVEGLKASIRSQGVLQNLIVCPQLNGKGKTTGKYEVVGGKRRLRALKELVADKDIAKDEAILCRVKPTRDAAEASLAENVEREAMHPADEVEAFKRLVDEGKSVDDVAARFALAPLTVQRRLRLANVSPKLMDAWRADQVSIEQLMALALTDDQAKQDEAFFGSAKWNRDPRQLRRLVVGEQIDAKADPLARFVTVKAYEKSGGAVVRDLFTDDNAGYLVDAALLQQLALVKLQVRADKVQAEGWSWVEVCMAWPHVEAHLFGRASQGRREPTAKQRKQIERLEAQAVAHEAALNALDDVDEPNDEESDRLERLLAETRLALEQLNEDLAEWTPATMAHAGAVVTIDRRGQVEVQRGLIRPEDKKTAPAARKQEGARQSPGSGDEPAQARLSEALMRRLTAHRTAALQAVLASRIPVALACLTHAMLRGVLDDHGFEGRSALHVRATACGAAIEQHADDVHATPAWTALAQLRDTLLSRVPSQREAVLPWLLALPQDELLQLLALVAALTLNAVSARAGEHEADAVARAETLLDGRRWLPTPLRSTMA